MIYTSVETSPNTCIGKPYLQEPACIAANYAWADFRIFFCVGLKKIIDTKFNIEAVSILPCPGSVSLGVLDHHAKNIIHGQGHIINNYNNIVLRGSRS